ncbi:hypothetical protein CALVIDRAFT_211940 [Calocera viscosa TUFC12733]|uniref:Pali-domain-containing protein n=1 Tax=Calocera viscosa (strain TUFC12733) TaxID=1330018 RepID=A0A167RC59_CALVF|nr:hypothetical protein CALVIDRAFT_211940 [Calocera viscosa TUFC12733]
MVKGPVIIGVAQGLSLIAVILLVFAHVGQINTSKLPSSLSMVSMNVTSFASCLENSTGDPFPGMYQPNASAPLGEHLGLRDIYSWGFFSYCASVVTNTTVIQCTNHTFGYRFNPLDAMLSDILSNSSTISQFTIPQTTQFTNMTYLGNLSNAGFYLIFVGTLCAFLATVLAIKHHRLTFAISMSFLIASIVLVLAGSALWTTIVQGAMQINMTPAAGGSCLGIAVSHGTSQWLIWAAFAVLVLSLPPYVISFVSYDRALRPHEVRLDRHVSGRRYKDPTYYPPKSRALANVKRTSSDRAASGAANVNGRPPSSRQASRASTPARPAPTRQSSQVSAPARPRPSAERQASSYNTYPTRKGTVPPPTRQTSQNTAPSRKPPPTAPATPMRQGTVPSRKGTYG